MGSQSPGRTLGFGLILAGGIIGALVVLWLLANAAGGQLRAGGLVLGLAVGAVLALPLLIAGAYLLRRSELEAQETSEFVERSRILDADRLVRGELTRELGQQRERLETLRLQAPDPALVEAATRLQALRNGVEQPAYAAEPAWYSAVRLTEPDLAAVRNYDDLVLDQARQIDRTLAEVERGSQQPTGLLDAIARLEASWAERNDLLLRGRRAVRAAELLASGELGTPGLNPAELKLGDAATLDGEDYLVQARLSYFAGDRTWTMLRLVQPRHERWLLAGPAPGVLSWLEPTEPGAVARFAEVEAGTATVTVETPKRTESGIFVEYRRLQSPTGDIAWLERWPDHQRAYQGRAIRPEELELWPRQG
ncbi:MAG: DUF4178 domain-containing protein [Chloroflexi bacterium]|nr:DUF4178 domain-containing protein [Chloroflexota bacterium]